MATPIWSPGTPYPTGSLVQPLTPIAPVPTALTNPGFDTGNTTGWTFSGAGSTAVTTLNSQAGTYNLALDNGEVIGQNAEFPATPGLTINASIYVRLSSGGTSAGRVRLWWFDAAHVQIGSPVDGALIQKPASSSERWVLSSLSAVAPALTAYVRVGFWSNSGVGSGDTRVDSLSWDYTSATSPSGLIFEATQVGLGISAGTEPVWPSSPGIPVNDGSVVWEGIIANRVIWEASPIMVSGATEPTWPEVVGESVTDGTVSWETVSLRVEDENCPNSKVVTIASSKVYAADEDLVRYCATVNPLDWTAADDAGYLATGLNQYGSNRTAVLNTYRSNVVPFSASTFQNWQVDPDPANITLLDSMEGIGSTYQQAAHPVANELFYLSPLGVRTVGIAAGTANLSAGDAGAPIDPLVEGALRTVGVRPLAAYYPNQGQYWLMMRPPLPVVVGPSITGDAPNTESGMAYVGFAYTVTPGDAPIANVYISAGTFPPGLTFSSAGVIGTDAATTLGSYTFTVTAVDENGLTASVEDTIKVGVAIGLLGGSIATSRPFLLLGAAGGTDWDNAYAYNGNTPLLMGTGLLGGGGRWLTWEGSGVSSPVYSTDATGTSWTTSAAVFESATKAQFGCYEAVSGAFLIPANNGVYRTVDHGVSLTKVTTIPAFSIDASPTLAMAASNFEASVSTAPTPFTTWTLLPTAHNITFSSGGIVRYGGDEFLIGGGNGSGNPKLTFTAAGASFSTETLPTLTAGYISAAAYDPASETWVAGTSAGQFIYKVGAGAWTLSAFAFGTNVAVKSMEWTGVNFVAAGNHNVSLGLGVVAYSTAGIGWTPAPTAAAINAQALAVMK